MLPIEKKFFALAGRSVNAANNDVRNLARTLCLHLPHFFTFVYEDGVEPTNNAAYRIMPRSSIITRSNRHSPRG